MSHYEQIDDIFKNENILEYLRVSAYEQITPFLYKKTENRQVFILTSPDIFNVYVNKKFTTFAGPVGNDLRLIGQHLRKCDFAVIMIKINYYNQKRKNHFVCFVVKRHTWTIVNPHRYVGSDSSEEWLNTFVWKKFYSFKLQLNRRNMQYMEFVYPTEPS